MQIIRPVELPIRESDTTYQKDYKRARILQTIIDIVVIIIIMVIFLCVLFLVDPKIQYMTCADSDITFPYKADTVPFWAVGLFATIGPLLVIIVVEIFNLKLIPCSASAKLHKRNFRAYAICVFHAISLFALGISINLLLTEIGKRWIGRLRPHFLAVCLPDYTQINCTTSGLTGSLYNSIYTGGSFCTGDASKVKEARLSFPSGYLINYLKILYLKTNQR